MKKIRKLLINLTLKKNVDSALFSAYDTPYFNVIVTSAIFFWNETQACQDKLLSSYNYDTTDYNPCCRHVTCLRVSVRICEAGAIDEFE